jgi:hypothetical protein
MLAEPRDFFLFKVFRPALGLTTPSIQWNVGSLSFGGGGGGLRGHRTKTLHLHMPFCHGA